MGSGHTGIVQTLGLLTTVVLVRLVICDGNKTSTQEILEQLFSEEKYNRNIRPNTDEGHNTEVSAGMYVQSLGSVSELEMQYTVNLYFRLSWTDPRLQYNHTAEYLTVDAFWKTKIWLPDPYFINSKEEHFHIVTVPNILLRIYPDGRVMYSQRLSLTLACNMELRKFPMDTQVCTIQIMSYAFTIQDIVMKWMDVSMNQAVELPEFDVGREMEKGDCTQVHVTGTYSCLVGRFTLTRRLSYYMVQTYVPSILIVVLSWVNFWLDASATPARVSLGLLCVLTMTTQNSGILSTLPRVSYVKSIDVWSSACLVFVFGALVEFAIVNVQSRKQEIMEKKQAGKERGVKAAVLTVSGALPADRDPEDPDKPSTCRRHALFFTADRIDFFSRIVFPLSFLIFNLIYWEHYL